MWYGSQVKLDALNDSKQIALSIYNVVVLSLLGAVISLAVNDDVNVTYGAISTLQILGTMITINTVFVTKVGSNTCIKITLLLILFFQILAFKKGETATGPILSSTTLEGTSRVNTINAYATTASEQSHKL